MKLNEIAYFGKEAVQASRKRKQDAAKERSADLVEVAKDYKKNIKVVLDKHLFFFRVSESHDFVNAGYGILDGESELNWPEQRARTTGRSSVFGNGNWFMSWVDSQWKNFPKRAMSYFATQKSGHAREFGRSSQMALIIPADNVTAFGWMPEDFNNATKPQTLMAAVQAVLTTVRRCLHGKFTPLLKKLGEDVFISRGIDIYAADLPNPTTKNIMDYFEAIDELLDNIFQIQQRSSNQRQEELLLSTLKNFRSELKGMGKASLVEYAKEITPEDRDAKLFTEFGQIKKSSSSDADELWFEGRYLAIYWYEEDTLEGLQKLYDQL